MKFGHFCCHHLRGGVDWNEDVKEYLRTNAMSPPSRWCGLKCSTPICPSCSYRHHLRGGVDWNCVAGYTGITTGTSPPSRWCGLKSVYLLLWRLTMSHHLRGGVDWNAQMGELLECRYVTTFAVVWIEIPCPGKEIRRRWSHHLRGGVDWNSFTHKQNPQPLQSPPSRWCGLKYALMKSGYAVYMSPPSRWCGLK